MDASDKPAEHSDVVFCCAVVFAWVAIILTLVISNVCRPAENIHQHPCINNLRMIDGARQTWGLENNKGPGDVPTWADILPYLGRGGETNDKTKEALKCPQGGVISLGPLSNHPACTFPGHVLP